MRNAKNESNKNLLLLRFWVILLIGLLVIVSFFCFILSVRAYFYQVSASSMKETAETYRDLYEQCNNP